MPRFLMVSRALGLVGITLALLGGCGQKQTIEPTDPNLQIHKIQSLDKEALNSPLSKQAKARGAQVAPPPIR